MRQLKGLARGVDGFARDRGGNFAVLFGAAASVLALGVGFAVNIAQVYNARSSLQSVVDAAVTSTARDLTLGIIKEADANASVQAFLDANSAAGILQAGQIVLDKLTIDRTSKTVQVNAHADVGLYSAVQRWRYAACRRLDHRALFGQEDRGGADARHHRFHGGQQARQDQ
ncbi:TadE/TadG family type IV pilus assembly protein [Mesorhizobium sp. WSM3866]|uniref:TadE/TadG family type IV pilus assembly protein n=1 Tax=Mesorhizobium sp. WSM3866 TaxID=422271 RepID=UPI0032AF3B2A